MKGLDYAWGRPSPSGLRAQGFQFVSRYLSWLPNGKVISIAERDQLLMAGLDISLNWEFAAGDQLNGAGTGATHAREAVRQAQALGYPPGSTIYYSSDTDVTRAQWDGPVKAYQLSARAVTNGGGYRFGIYGGYDVIRWSFDEGVAQDGWQTYAWSEGRWDSRAHMRQTRNNVTVLGVDCDLDETVGPVTLWKNTGGDMALTVQQEAELVHAVGLINQHFESTVWRIFAVIGDQPAVQQSVVQGEVNVLHNRLTAITAAITAANAAITAANNGIIALSNAIAELGVVTAADHVHEISGTTSGGPVDPDAGA